MSADEVELKLILAAGDMARIRRIPAIANARLGRARSTLLRATYYDTPDFSLADAGITVRIRNRGREDVLTVKTAGTNVGGLFGRGEWESVLALPVPDPAHLVATGLEPLADPDLVAHLTPVFTTEIRRTTMMLTGITPAGEDWRVELALDSGSVTAGERREDVFEAELELLDGPPAVLFRLARDIVRSVPARLSAESKSDRGLRLRRGGTIGPVRAAPVALDPAMNAAASFRAIAHACLSHFLANEDVLLAVRDGEAIHQMRVALRRLRSALKIFRPLVSGPDLERIRDDIRWLLAALGPARDIDVFLREVVEPVMETHPHSSDLAALHAAWTARREEAVEAARDAVASRRFTEMLLDIGEWLEAGDWRTHPAGTVAITHFAAPVLAKLRRKTLKTGGKRLAELSSVRLHDVRLLAKQWRYACEFFDTLHRRKAVRPTAKALARLQDTLGVLNDIAVAEARLAPETDQGSGESWARGLIQGWHAARRPDLLREAGQAWKMLRKV